jgi:glutathione synthase/RimK-type ligase-like ATP-grasp enzyme
MKIAIHKNNTIYTQYWIEYCQNHNIEYKLVDAYDTDIINILSDCDIFMWYFSHLDYRDTSFAKQLIFSLEESGKIVFPNSKTCWHFDDKLGQKYLFESLGINAAKAYAFYDKASALQWAQQQSYPKVFKLRGGAGSSNVMLAKNYNDAKKYINRAFGNGYMPFRGVDNLKNTIKLYKGNKASIYHLLVSLYRCFVYPTKVFSKFLLKQVGYAYFQDFIPNDGFDYRIETCGNKAIALVRYCRKGDFRASGGHNNSFSKELIPQDVLKLSFEITEKLGMQAASLDFVREKSTGKLYLVEVSYCYGPDADQFDHGYWTSDGEWHSESFNGINWMIECAIDEYKQRRL